MARDHLGLPYGILKRFYVKEGYRGHNVGESLLTKLIELARDEGYKEMVLDTLITLTDALRVYKDLDIQTHIIEIIKYTV